MIPRQGRAPPLEPESNLVGDVALRLQRLRKERRRPRVVLISLEPFDNAVMLGFTRTTSQYSLLGVSS